MILIICPLLLLFLASDGCLQYFTGVSGQMFSFNYNDATVRSTKIFVLLFLLHFIYILVINRFCLSHALSRASNCPTRTTRCVSEWKGTSVGSNTLPVLIQVLSVAWWCLMVLWIILHIFLFLFSDICPNAPQNMFHCVFIFSQQSGTVLLCDRRLPSSWQCGRHLGIKQILSNTTNFAHLSKWFAHQY